MSRWILANLSKNWGGGEKWMFTTAKALQAVGHSVHLIVYPKSQLAKQAEQAHLPCFSIKARSYSLFNPFKAGQVFQFFRHYQPDLLILNSSPELKFLGIIAKISQIPHIIFRRGIPQAPKKHVLNRWYFKHVLQGVIVNSQATQTAMEKHFFNEMSQLRVQVIYNGIDLEQWKHEKVQHSTKIIGVVGRLSYEKGIDRALEVFSKVKTQIPESQLKIIGEGQEEFRLKQFAKELGLLPHIHFVGFVENVIEQMKEFDVLLLPSRWEGFGYVLVEAMSLQVPPVAFDIGATREILTEETGVIVPDGNLDACAEAIVNLLQNNEVRWQMGKEARIRVENNFSLQRVVEQLEEWLA